MDGKIQEAESGGRLMIVIPDLGETPTMTSDRAWMLARHPISLERIDQVLAQCRKEVWEKHRGCKYNNKKCNY